MKRLITLIITVATCFTSNAQDELLALLESESNDKEYVYATFKSTRLINGQSIEMRTKGAADNRL